MEEEVGGVLALVQGAHPPITHANTSWTDFQINFLEHLDLEIWVTKVDARPVGRLVFLLVLLVDLEPQAWNISEGTLQLQKKYFFVQLDLNLGWDLTCHRNSLPWQRTDCQQVQETVGRTAAEGCTSPEIEVFSDSFF